MVKHTRNTQQQSKMVECVTPGWARRGKTNLDSKIQTGQDRTRQGKTGEDRAEQYRTGQGKTGQNRAAQTARHTDRQSIRQTDIRTENNAIHTDNETRRQTDRDTYIHTYIHTDIHAVSNILSCTGLRVSRATTRAPAGQAVIQWDTMVYRLHRGRK